MASVTLDATGGANSRVKAFEKTSSDVYNDTIMNARDIGQLRKNYSRLSLITTLSENEKEDWFSFTSVSKGKARLSAVNLSDSSDNKNEKKTDESATSALEDAKNDYEQAIKNFQGKNMRVELYAYINKRQTLLASNDESNKKAYENFKSIMRGEFELDKTTYYIHVTTEDGSRVDKDTLYALQLQMGDTYEQDYLTKETSISHKGMTDGDLAYQAASEEAAAGNSCLSGSLLAAQGAASILENGYTNLVNINNAKHKNAAATLFSILC